MAARGWRQNVVEVFIITSFFHLGLRRKGFHAFKKKQTRHKTIDLSFEEGN